MRKKVEEQKKIADRIKQVESQLHTFYFVTGSLAIIAGITIVVLTAKSLH